MDCCGQGMVPHPRTTRHCWCGRPTEGKYAGKPACCPAHGGMVAALREALEKIASITCEYCQSQPPLSACGCEIARTVLGWPPVGDLLPEEYLAIHTSQKQAEGRE